MHFFNKLRCLSAIVLGFAPTLALADNLTSATIAVNRGVNPSILCIANAGVCSVNLGTYAGGVFTPAGLAAEILRAQTAEATNAGNISANATAITNEAATARAAEALAFPSSQAGGAARLNVGTTAGTVAPGCTIATGGITCRDPATRAADRINIRDFGALGDALAPSLTVSIAAGSTTLTSTVAGFSAAMVGKVINVPGAGASGATLVSTVAAYVSGTQITLTDAASTALSASKQTILIGTDDAAPLAAAITLANTRTGYTTSPVKPAQGACVYIPAGNYLIRSAPPQFKGPGCVEGDGPHQSAVMLGASFGGDLFSWDEAWGAYGIYANGPRIGRLHIVGAGTAPAQQNAVVFYDRNDNISMDDVDIENVPGRALAMGLLRPVPPYPFQANQAYARESHFRSIRIFRSGLATVPAMEIACQANDGSQPDCDNELGFSQVDIYGAAGTSLAIRNSSTGVLRGLKFDQLRIEGYEAGTSLGNLLQIGDPAMSGAVGHLSFTNLELIDPAPGYCSVAIDSSATAGTGPNRIFMQGFLGGGVGAGNGLCLNNTSLFRGVFDQIRSTATAVVVGPGATGVFLDGLGAETSWTYSIDPTSLAGVSIPLRRTGNPSLTGAANGTAAVSGTVSTDAVSASAITLGSGGLSVSGGSVTLVTLTSKGSYTGVVGALPLLTIAAPPAGGTTATAVVTGMQYSQVIGSGLLSGTGYSVNDLLTVQGGTVSSGSPTILKVTTIDGNGKPTGLTVSGGNTSGTYTVLPPDVANVTGGTGTGGTIRVAYFISSNSITSGGTGYQTPPAVTGSASSFGAASGTGAVSTTLPIAAATGKVQLDTNGTTLGTSGTTGGPVRSIGAQHLGATTFVASASVTAGATQTAAANTDGLVLGNTAAVSTQTVKLPVITGLSGQVFTLSSDGGITTLTLQTSSGGTITNSPTTLSAGVGRTLISDGTAWHVRQ